MDADLIIRGGTVVDGTGAPARRADVAIAGDRIVAVEHRRRRQGPRARSTPTGRVVTPGFVDVHTHLDAQLGWDPLPTSSCWHGITSVVLGNCGVTFAPVGPGQREFLAEMMESVEDIPREAILDGLPWDWTTYGEYLGWLDRTPKGINVGGLVGHCALRVAAMGDRAMTRGRARPRTSPRCARWPRRPCAPAPSASRPAARSATSCPTAARCPGTWAGADELLAFGDVLRRTGRGLFEGAMRLGERDDDALTKTRAEVAVMGEISRRSGRPCQLRAGPVGPPARPVRAGDRVHQGGERHRCAGAPADHRPRHRHHLLPVQPHAVGPHPGVARAPRAARRRSAWPPSATPSAGPAWSPTAGARQARLLGSDKMFVLPDGPARYDCKPEDSLAAHAARRGVSPVEAFIDLAVESNGVVNLNMPLLNQQPERGRGDARRPTW